MSETVTHEARSRRHEYDRWVEAQIREAAAGEADLASVRRLCLPAYRTWLRRRES